MQWFQRHMTLKGRIVLFFTAFFAVLLVQLYVNHYQSTVILDQLDRQNGNFHSISRFSAGVDNQLTALENFRWENGDLNELAKNLQAGTVTADAWLRHIDGDLQEVGEEQYLLAQAVFTTYGNYDKLMEQIDALLQAGDASAAATLYYNQVSVCGRYLQQYTGELLRTAITEGQSTYTRLSALNERLKAVQTVASLLCVVLGALVVHAVWRLLDLILLVLGCIMDMAPIILIATPILLPIATSIGIDPIQFGIIVMLNCGIGLLTPPVGSVLFIGSAVAKRPMEKVVVATLPFYLCMIIALLLITFIPDISLFIPKLAGYVPTVTPAWF